jgi:hypothetical protein
MADEDMDLPIEMRRELMAAAVDKQLSYGWLCGIYRAGLLAGRAAKIGATGEFPYGKLDRDDEGELAVAVAADPHNGVVRFEFGKSITWLALPPAHARQFAAVLLDKAREVERRVS